MKKILLSLIILLSLVVNGNAANSSVQSKQAVEQSVAKSDTVSQDDSSKPIIKTVVMEEEGELSTRDKWITGILAAFGFVGVLVIRLLRKKKKKQN